MRKIDTIILHHSASDIPAHDNIEVIRHWHTEERGWADIGYHFYITRAGLLQRGRPVDQSGAHCYGENSNSIGICLGGINSFTKHQFLTLADTINALMTVFGDMDIYGHCEFDPVNKPNCPGFDVKDFVKEYLFNQL